MGGHLSSLVVSRSVYDDNPDNVKVSTVLPLNCAATKAVIWKLKQLAASLEHHAKLVDDTVNEAYKRCRVRY